MDLSRREQTTGMVIRQKKHYSDWKIFPVKTGILRRKGHYLQNTKKGRNDAGILSIERMWQMCYT